MKKLYLKREALHVGLRASLLEVKDGMWSPRNEAPNHKTLWPVAFASKILTSTETWYSNIEREALCILHGLEKSITTVSPTKSV